MKYDSTDKACQGISQDVSQKISEKRDRSSIARSELWRSFIRHFKNEETGNAYLTEIQEFEQFCEKSFLETEESDVEAYYFLLKEKVESGQLSARTFAKKFWEIHSFAAYADAHREEFGIPSGFADEFYPYLKKIKAEEQFVYSVPIEHLDALYRAAQEDLMAYTMIALIHRAGLSSTEIAMLKPEDLSVYENGTFAYIEGQERSCFIPEDAAAILTHFLEERENVEFLFYNRSKNPLNKMYISRMLKKYTQKAGIPSYSAEKIRTTCGQTLFSYGAKAGQVAKQMGITRTQIQKYQNRRYRDDLLVNANTLVKIKVEPPV